MERFLRVNGIIIAAAAATGVPFYARITSRWYVRETRLGTTLFSDGSHSLPDQYLKSTTHSYRNRGLWEARSVLPAPLYHPRALAIRFETREIILLLHLARRSSSLPFFSRPFWPHRQVWIETLRVIIPGLQYGRRRLNLSFSLLPLFGLYEHVSRNFSTRHSMDVLAPRCLLSFKPLSFYLSQIITLAKMSRAYCYRTQPELTLCHVTSCHITSYHIVSRKAVWQYRSYCTIINWWDTFFNKSY